MWSSTSFWESITSSTRSSCTMSCWWTDGQAAAAVELHSFFDDPDTFPPEQTRALESVDAQLLADERGAASERGAVTEYELRFAREDILSLQEKLESLRQDERASATSSAELREYGSFGHDNDCNNYNHDVGGGAQPEMRGASGISPPMGDMERRDLTCAVEDFPVSAGYKLTAMTFHEEVDQDLDDWVNHVPDALRR